MVSTSHAVPENFRTIVLSNDGASAVVSSLGTGTYLGDANPATDEAVVTAIIYAATHGWNIIDTASNYRWGMAELSVGEALNALLAGSIRSEFKDTPELDITRDMLFISTKAGFVTDSVAQELLAKRALTSADIVQRQHCIHPAYLNASLALSLQRMNLATVDLLYLHNAAEMQLPAVGREVFTTRLKDAFAALEDARKAGTVRQYGLATWDSFRVPPESNMYLSLEEVVKLAKEVGGEGHGFRFVQLPVNSDMPEAHSSHWQTVEGQAVTLLEAAQKLGVNVVVSGPLLQAQLVQSLTGQLDGFVDLLSIANSGSKLLQVARSTPQVSTVLVGHKAKEHVIANVALTQLPPLAAERWGQLSNDVAGLLRRVRATAKRTTLSVGRRGAGH